MISIDRPSIGPSLVSFVFLFSSLVFFAFVSVCVFVEIKIYILIYNQPCGQVSDKKISPSQFPETRLFLSWSKDRKFKTKRML